MVDSFRYENPRNILCRKKLVASSTVSGPAHRNAYHGPQEPLIPTAGHNLGNLR